MKKIVLSIAALATVAMAEADISHPVERIEEAKEITPVTEKSIFDRIHFKGDLRVRYESKETDYYDGSESNKYLGRYRLRLGSHIDITDNLQFEVGMRSGFGNPTSGNQTFVESNKDTEGLADYFFQSLRFNILAIDYTSGNSIWKIGRSPYMMYRPIKSQLVWDNDLSMNGLNYQYQDDTKIITAGINQPSYAEDVTAADDVNLFLAQYVQKTKLENATLNVGAGIYYYDGLKGNTPLYGKDMGNTVVDGVYTNDYHIVEGFAELKFKDVLGKPFAIAAGVAYNTAADDNNFGYDLAFQLGKAKEVGDWQVKYSYTDIQEDAVFGAHSDSDNFGGGTAAKGHAIRTKYKFGKNTYLAGTYFINTLYGSKVGDPADADYERVQLDAIIEF
ncbi:putative porin [Sulfurovum mangrovi]|uniref:putative porin n=1 Tax=Sulfurovum mangrovi TaxID=2893889 RepID=UPI001E4FAA51|nr:putative porin [Sulfurovum mangrovi]UFH59112.1 putative porin [Sulfurovum mangrovi]